MNEQTYDYMVDQNTLDPDPVLVNWVNGFPKYTNMDYNQYITMPNKYAEFIYRLNNIQPDIQQEIEYTKGKFARILEHEIGHVFGLHHASISPHYGLNECLYSIMHQGGNIPANNQPWLPPSEIAEIHRNLHVSSARKYVDSDVQIRQYIVQNEQTWDWDIKLYGNLIIKSGGTLTLNCSIKMPSYAKIIVETGGKLIVDGGLITSAHDEPWQGIEVWGNSSAHQYADANGNRQQGYLELKNGATIENAITAVSLWKPGNCTTTGGIIKADDAVFLNNARAVHALYYNNYIPNDPTQHVDNLSRFNNCSFEIDEEYPGTETFSKHIDLLKVKGFKFRGCDFEVKNGVAGVSTWSSAIAAYSAGFRVDGLCSASIIPCPAANTDSTYFSGFWKAILATGDFSNNNTFYVNKANFSNNYTGIDVNTINNFVVINNTFEVGRSPWNGENCDYGIRIDNGAGFAVEDNLFSITPNLPPSVKTGINVLNSPSINEIYRNSFDGLSIGNYAYGTNFFDRGANEGLSYICNENQNNWADFYAYGDNNSGIQFMQGGLAKAAGNTFSPTGATWHFYNETSRLIGYYYLNGSTVQYPEYVEFVTREPVTTANSCPSHYGGIQSKSIQLTDAETQALAAEFGVADNAFSTIKTLYDQLTDGGSTENSLAEIAMAQPDDMWQLRSKLLGDSPHLSEEVLKMVADKTEVFTEAAIFDVLAANPDELRKVELITYLEEKENPLPGYMIDILKQVAEGTSYRTVLTLQMTQHNSLRNRAAQDIIRSLTHSEEPDRQELRNWFANLQSLQADRQIIAFYLEENSFDEALMLAETLPAIYALEDDDLQEHNRFISLIQLQQSLQSENRKPDSLTTAEKSQLENMADLETASGAIARGILEFFFGETTVVCPSMQETVPEYKSSTPASVLQLTENSMQISVKPNPATAWAAFDYVLPEKTSQAMLSITNASGKLVREIPLNQQQGQYLLDTRELAPGTYTYTLSANGVSKTAKLVIN